MRERRGGGPPGTRQRGSPRRRPAGVVHRMQPETVQALVRGQERHRRKRALEIPVGDFGPALGIDDAPSCAWPRDRARTTPVRRGTTSPGDAIRQRSAASPRRWRRGRARDSARCRARAGRRAHAEQPLDVVIADVFEVPVRRRRRGERRPSSAGGVQAAPSARSLSTVAASGTFENARHSAANRTSARRASSNGRRVGAHTVVVADAPIDLERKRSAGRRRSAASAAPGVKDATNAGSSSFARADSATARRAVRASRLLIDFAAAADDRERRARLQSPRRTCVASPSTPLRERLVLPRVVHVGEHEVLPDQDARARRTGRGTRRTRTSSCRRRAPCSSPASRNRSSATSIRRGIRGQACAGRAASSTRLGRRPACR